MRAMILAAGYGKRMAPLTTERPKALLSICGRPLLAHLLSALERQGFHEIAVNSHHLAEQIHGFIEKYRRTSCVRLFESFEAEILDTGGGIKKMLEFFPGNQPVLVHNVDILSDCDLRSLMAFHVANRCTATLVIQRHPSERPLRFDERLIFLGRGQPMDVTPQNYSFCGIQVIQPELFRQYEQRRFYSIDLYVDAAQRGKRIGGYVMESGYWRDIGRPEDIAQAEADIKSGRFSLD